MELPNKERVVVEAEKVRGYLLNEAHPDGYEKAEFFSAKGFHQENWCELADALRRLAREGIVTKSMTSSHGQKCIVDGLVKTPSGQTVLLRTVWIVDVGVDAPRLVTVSTRRGAMMIREHD